MTTAWCRAKRHTLANALRIAADEYARMASLQKGERWTVPTGAPRDGLDRIIASFEAQATDARRLADEIEQADAVQLED